MPRKPGRRVHALPRTLSAILPTLGMVGLMPKMFCNPAPMSGV